MHTHIPQQWITEKEKEEAEAKVKAEEEKAKAEAEAVMQAGKITQWWKRNKTKLKTNLKDLCKCLLHIVLYIVEWRTTNFIYKVSQRYLLSSLDNHATLAFFQLGIDSQFHYKLCMNDIVKKLWFSNVVIVLHCCLFVPPRGGELLNRGLGVSLYCLCCALA